MVFWLGLALSSFLEIPITFDFGALVLVSVART